MQAQAFTFLLLDHSIFAMPPHLQDSASVLQSYTQIPNFRLSLVSFTYITIHT